MRIRFLVVLLLSFSVWLRAEDSWVSINFDNADLRMVIRFVSEVTGENFIVDEAVKGMVTVVAPTQIPSAQLRRVLESVLMVSGYTLVTSGKMTKVIPLETARQSSSDTLDETGSKSDHFVTQIIPLKHADAEKMMSLIQPFLTQGGHVTFYGPTNAMVLSDLASNVSRISQIIMRLDEKGVDTVPHLYVYPLKHSNAREVAQVLTQLFEKENKMMEGLGHHALRSSSIVVADEATNSLLIHSSKDRYKSLKKAIRNLDAPRKQVMVEVLIAEVNLDKVEKLGIEWATIAGAIYGSQEGFGKDRVNRIEDIPHHVLTGGELPGTTAGYVHDALRIGTLEIPRLGILINAFRNHADVNILSTPQILTTDHTQAEILVGENRAFIKNAQVTPEGSTVRTFEFKDIGLSLKLTPHISEDKLVRMEVHQKVEDVIGQSFEGAVETSKREAHTLITVRDSQTAVIGGLIRERKDKTIQKVPILGDIPIIGLPFTRKSEQTLKTNLLIFICPHIVDSQAKLSSISEKKRQGINGAHFSGSAKD